MSQGAPISSGDSSPFSRAHKPLPSASDSLKRIRRVLQSFCCCRTPASETECEEALLDVISRGLNVLVAYHEEKAYTKVLNLLKRASSDREELVDAARRESSRLQRGETRRARATDVTEAEPWSAAAVAIAPSPLANAPGPERVAGSHSRKASARSSAARAPQPDKGQGADAQVRSAGPSLDPESRMRELYALIHQQERRIAALEGYLTDVHSVAVMAYNSTHPSTLLRPPGVPARLFLGSQDEILTRKNQGIIDDTLRVSNEYIPGERLEVRQGKVLRLYGLDPVQSGGTSGSW